MSSEILRGVHVKMKYNVTLSQPIVIALLSDMDRGSTELRTQLVTISSSTSTMTQVSSSLRFRELSLGVKSGNQADLARIEFIKLEWEPLSTMNAGSSKGAIGNIYFG